MRLSFAIPSGLLAVALTSPAATAQGDIKNLKLREREPRPMLVAKATDVPRARFPAVDIPNHLGAGRQALTPERVRHYLEEMDAAGIRTVVNLDGGWGERLAETIAALDRAHPGRFLTFAQVDFEGFDGEGWTEREVARPEAGFRAGARGPKVHKSLSLGRRDRDGKLVTADDHRIGPLWDFCGRMGRPVVIHTGDPSAFFTPADRNNERILQLAEHPDWSFQGGDFPARAELLAQRLRVIMRHPSTTFVCARMANDGEDLSQLAGWLDANPNMLVGLDARISELGRQPFSARRSLIKYQDRVLFGTDAVPDRVAFRTYIRFLETDDE